jgi:hypothetical protein
VNPGYSETTEVSSSKASIRGNVTLLATMRRDTNAALSETIRLSASRGSSTASRSFPSKTSKANPLPQRSLSHDPHYHFPLTTYQGTNPHAAQRTSLVVLAKSLWRNRQCLTHARRPRLAGKAQQAWTGLTRHASRASRAPLRDFATNRRSRISTACIVRRLTVM